MTYINRQIGGLIAELSAQYPVIVVTGPRQSGKTTLCRHIFSTFDYFNLEEPSIREIIAADPKGFLQSISGNAIIDEVQHLPVLFSYIQAIVDDNPDKKFVLTGSSNFALMEKVTQSLAGRAALFTVLPFSFLEMTDYINTTPGNDIIINGFYPGVIVKKIKPWHFYDNYLSTYIERDLRQLKNIDNLPGFELFVKLLAGRVGTELNQTSLATEVGVSVPTIKSWLSILETSYIAFLLRPYYRNLNKRLTKTPKVYFYDTGLVCRLLGISKTSHLETHPLRGAIFENMVVAEMAKQRFNSGKLFEMYYYRENKGREVDIVVDNGGRLRVFEVKSSQSFQSSYLQNLTYLKNLLGDDVVATSVVYDGISIPPTAINFRQIAPEA